MSVTRRVLLGSVSAFALPFVAALSPANAAGLPPGTALSIEGGGACPTGDDGTFFTSYSYVGVTASNRTSFGSNGGCGWTGRIGLFQEKPGVVFGFADFWGVFVRHQDFKSGQFGTSGANSAVRDFKYYFASVNSTGSFDEERTVVDFEVGKNIGIGSDGSKLRLFGGIRYANYSSTLRASGDTESKYQFIGIFNYSSSFSVHSGHSFEGVGPRLGLTGDMPLFGPFFLTGSVSGSLLWGDHEVRLNSSGFGFGARKFSDSDVVSNAEGELGVGMPFLMTGGKLIVGARWEGWFDQSQFKNYAVDLTFDCGCAGVEGTFRGKGSLDRNNWGPFVRLNIPLGGAPPPPP